MTLVPADLGLPSRFQSYRPKQFSTSLSIATASQRHSLLQATTGAGKTLIAATVARLLNGRTLLLTGTRALQSQAFTDYESVGMRLIQGASNYRCRDPRRRTCEHGDDDVSAIRCAYRRESNGTAPTCTQLAAQAVARDADLVIGNYATHLSFANRVQSPIGDFDLLWCDEAHSALEWLTDACAINLTHAELSSIGVDMPPVTGDASDWHAWSHVAISTMVDAYRRARDRGIPARRLAELTDLGTRLRALSNAASGVSDEVWVGEPTRIGCRYLSVWPARHAERLLWRGIPRVVWSSATLTHEDPKHLGLSRDDYSWHEVDAGFDPRRRPLYYLPVAKVDKDISDGSWRLCMNEWERFIGPRLKLGWRGVVQATSYDYARRFVADCKYREQCALHDRHNSRDVVAAFARGDGPPVLVSPAVKEGHDFANDTARWQIVIKAPTPNTLSPVLRARCQSDKAYRNHLTGRTLEQMCGRSTRSSDDFSECLIVDEHFGWLRGKQVFTRSFRATWRQVDAVPSPLEV